MTKSNKRRFCPAQQQEITSADCGENRNSRYQCPDSCQFNLFALQNYTQLLEAESRLDDLSLAFIHNEPRHSARIKQIRQKVDLNNPGEANPFFCYELFVRRDAQGFTCAERWENLGFPDLKNDLRCFARYKMNTTVRLLEAQRIIDAEQVEFVDLLQPERGSIVVRDRVTAARLCRYDVLLTFSYDLPFYSRLISGALVFPSWVEFPADEVLREIVRHLGGPTETPQLQLWVAEHFAYFGKALWETARARQALQLQASDLRYGKAIYNLNAPFSECRAVLDASSGVSPDDLLDEERRAGFAEARVWFVTEGGKERVATGFEVLGTIALGQSMWRLSAVGEKRLDTLRTRFEAALGNRVTFVATRLDDLHKSKSEPAWDESLVPPKLINNPSALSVSTSRIPKSFRPLPGEPVEVSLMRMQDRHFLDDSIPAMGGATPRQAAADPKLLPVLKRLLKGRINATDKMNLRIGASYDPRWYIEELGITDPVLDMPAARAKLDEDASPPGAAFEPELAPFPDPQRPRAPKVPANLPFDEVASRFARVTKQFGSLKETRQEMLAGGCTFLDDLEQLLPEEMVERYGAALETTIAHVWFTMVPPGTGVPEVPLENLHDGFQERINALLVARSPEEMLRVVTSRFQPNITNAAFSLLKTAIGVEMPRKRPDEEERLNDLLLLLAFVAVLVDELHLALS